MLRQKRSHSPHVFLVIFGLLVLSLMSVLTPVLATTGDFDMTGTVDTSDPKFNDNKVPLDCTTAWTGTNYHYESRTITVDKSVGLNFADVNNSPQGGTNDVSYVIYDLTTGTFDPANPTATPCVGGATNNLTVTLNTGHNYWMVIYHFNNPNGAPNYDLKVTSFDNSANVIVGAPGGAPPPVPKVVSVSSSAADGNYGSGVAMTITVTFDHPVQYYSIGVGMTISLSNGDSAMCTSCINQYPTPASTTYNFSYTTSSLATDLDEANINAIDLQSGMLQATDGTTANKAVPTPGAAGSLGANKNINIVSPKLSINSPTVTEGNSGTTAENFTVTLSPALVAPTVTVNYSSADSSATTADSDYTAVTGSLTFTSGQTSKTVAVNVNGDTKYEANETFNVDLSSPSGASFTTSSGTGTITNDDAAPTLSINTVTLNEGNSSITAFNFTVTLSTASGLTTTVNYATANGTATTADSDYTASSGTVTFTPGQTSKTVTVNVTGDTKNEANETFTVTLSSPSNATIGTGTGTGTITNDDPLPSLSIGNSSGNEGDSGTTNQSFTVTLSAVSGQTVTVNYVTADGTATTANNDYTASSGTVTFTPGQTSQTINVPVVGDTTYELNESYTVTLSTPSNATIATATGTGTITNDDPAPQLTINDVSLNEGNTGATTFTFTVNMSMTSLIPVTVNYAIADGTAFVGSNDYMASSGLLTFAPGETSKTINVAVNGDTLFEANETFTVNLSTPSNAAIADGSGTGTITNDDSAPTLSINSMALNEGNAGTTALTFTVSLSTASGMSTTVNYASADGTATTADNDYSATSGTLTFAAGETSKTINVSVKGDTRYEADEAFSVNLSVPTGATLATATGTGTITNDDGAPSLSINPVTLSEGNAGTTAFTFTVSLSTASGMTTTVNYASADGTATTADSDYAAASGTLTFAPDVTSQTITVNVNGDTKDEPDETFTVTLSGATNASISTATGNGTITNDDSAPSLSINHVTLNEGDSGPTPFSFSVSLSAASGKTISVNYATADGTATAGVDYAATSGSLTFAPGDTSKTATVVISGDTIYEADETFTVNLSSASNATISTATGNGTITNDDGQPMFSINDVSMNEGNTGTTTFTFTVSRSGDPSRTDTVDYATADGTATAGSDYTATSGTLTFAPNVTTQTITVAVTGEISYESDETFAVNLSNASTPAGISDGQGIGTIKNDDLPPGFSVADVTQAEGNSGTTDFTFTITRTGDTTVSSTVDYATADDTAMVNDNDYVAASGTLTFAPGESSHTVTVTVNGDGFYESDETFMVNLSNATAPATIGDAQAVGTITNDDVPPGISVGDVSVRENGGASQFTITLSPAVNGAVTVDYTIVDGTAKNGLSFVATGSGTLTFNTGDTSETVPFAVVDNNTPDGNHAFSIHLSNSSGPAIVRAVATATIVDNEIKVVTVDGPPPATPCKDTNFENPGMIRTHFTNDADRGGLGCRLLASNGSYLSWLGSPLTNSGNVGNRAVLDLGVIAAVDVFNPNASNGFTGDVDICLKGSGYMIYLDAKGAPRVPQLWSAWTTPSFPGYTCTTLYAPGTVVLVSQKPK